MQGILTTDLSAPVEGVSTVREMYRQPEGPQVRCVGSRREALLHQLHAMVSKEVEEEFAPAPPTVDYHSTTRKDFFQGDEPCYMWEGVGMGVGLCMPHPAPRTACRLPSACHSCLADTSVVRQPSPSAIRLLHNRRG